MMKQFCRDAKDPFLQTLRKIDDKSLITEVRKYLQHKSSPSVSIPPLHLTHCVCLPSPSPQDLAESASVEPTQASPMHSYPNCVTQSQGASTSTTMSTSSRSSSEFESSQSNVPNSSHTGSKSDSGQSSSL
ncbi:unnamed protein product [Vicia faba]|uniref:Uncharacterized protein n=1 Tax=Vicia faba TaxID=3906 RepID=A0AAV0ZY30_VICFA|nr:unnamed protein product [Vicia faba]